MATLDREVVTCGFDQMRVIGDQYVWFIWSAAFLLAWLAAFAALPMQRKAMLWASIFTTPFGLTEPIFVPPYWNPPSLFDLARTTGFDVESFVFSFGIGGIGAALYNVLVHQRAAPVPTADRAAPAHALHRSALAIPFVAFPLLYLLPWNPIYAAILAMALGAAAAAWCRPELARKTLIGALLFTAYYALFLAALEWTIPGYIARVWNLPALSGVVIAALPLEELLFAAAFGAYWSTVYDHFTWHRLSQPRHPATRPVAAARRRPNSFPRVRSRFGNAGCNPSGARSEMIFVGTQDRGEIHMKRIAMLTLVAMAFAVNAGGAFAQGGTHVMWNVPYKSTAYGVWHDNASCPNPPRR